MGTSKFKKIEEKKKDKANSAMSMSSPRQERSTPELVQLFLKMIFVSLFHVSNEFQKF